MLFDLKGRRRRVVQGTYVLLAVLMGGGLILFGIGGGTNGGLLDAFKGGGGSSNGNEQLQKRIDAAQRQLAVNPQNTNALGVVIRNNYNLATSTADPNTGIIPADGKKYLQRASDAWKRYLGTNPKRPDPLLANYMFQAYSQTGLNRANDAKSAALIVAASQKNSSAYIRVVQYATLAGDTRTANLAEQKALDLAPKSQRGSVKKLIQQAKGAGATTSTQSGNGGGGG